MRLRLKEDPREWRKALLLGLLGPAALFSLLRYRGVASAPCLAAVLVLLALVALCACARPRWFRGYYRFTTRLGFYIVQALGWLVLAALFFAILTPFSWILRRFGVDLLQLKPPGDRPTYWHTAKKTGSLDRLF
jgi:hypothetical protein